MANQYGYTGLTPQLHLRREAYRKGLRSGRQTKTYDAATMARNASRFMKHYGDVGRLLVKEWLEGWHDAEIYRDVQIIACERNQDA